jgi:tight adherence protein B
MSEVISLIIAMVVAILTFMGIMILIGPRYNRLKIIRLRLERVSGGRQERWNPKTHSLSARNQAHRMERRINEVLKAAPSLMQTFRLMVYRSQLLKNPEIFLLILALEVILFIILPFFYIPLHPFQVLMIGTLFIFGATYYLVNFLAERWQKIFIKQFPQALDVIIRGLNAGLTLGRGMNLVAEEMSDPVGFEFRYLSAQLQLGLPTEQALKEASVRIGIQDFQFFTLALIIQKEMGGSLSEILRKLSDVIRKREQFRKKVRALSAEARTTAIIVGSLPFLAMMGIEIISPGYLGFFFSDSLGQTLLTIVCFLTISSIVILNRMVKMES